MSNKPIFAKIKGKINNINLLRKLFLKIPHLLFRLDPIVPLHYTIKLTYYLRMEKRIDLENPKDFNEKIQWLKIYYRDPLYVQCADKYRVRDYVANKGFEGILNKLYKVYEKAEDIDFDELPERFAMKTNHACKTHIICDDKSQLNKVETRKKFDKWLKKKK